MFKVNVVCVGKIKEKFYTDGINEYAKRLSRYAEFTITEVNEINFQKVDSDAIVDLIKEKEADNILPVLKGEVYSMAIEGKKYSSQGFARLIENVKNSTGVITFVIGGSYGLSERVKNASKGLISFADMTFPHQLFRLMLTEQIYRAFTILENTPYHK